jgi:hypothetical protein
MIRNILLARQAALTMLRMAKEAASTNPSLAARYIEAAADLKEQAGELSPKTDQSVRAPDSQSEG